MRTLLILLIGICGAFSVPTHSSAEEHSRAFGGDASTALSACRGMVEEHVSGVLRALRVIAVTDAAKSGSWEKVKPLVDRLSEDLATDATTWFVHPDGQYFSTEGEAILISTRSYASRVQARTHGAFPKNSSCRLSSLGRGSIP